MMNPMQPQDNAPAAGGGINPQMLSQMMPHLLTFAAGAGFKELVANFEKIHKLMGAGQGENAGAGAKPTPNAQAPVPSPNGAAPTQPPQDQLMMLMQLLKARQAAGGMQ